MSSPLISVIIPVYNAENTLGLSLDGLATQSMQDFEVIIVDGASSDRTVEIARRYQTRIGQMIIHSERDKGVYDAMNKGIQLAKGQWLYFFSGNDRLAGDDVFQELHSYLSISKSDLVYGDVLLRSDGSRYAGEFDRLRLLIDRNICHQSVFYSREIILSTGGYNLNYSVWADWDLNIRCFSRPGVRTQYVNMVIAHFDDVEGISRNGDPVFSKLLPVTYIQENARLHERLKALELSYKGQISDILHSTTYKMGNRIARIGRFFGFGRKL